MFTSPESHAPAHRKDMFKLLSIVADEFGDNVE